VTEKTGPLPPHVTEDVSADGTRRIFYKGGLICVDYPLRFAGEPLDGGGQRLTVTWVIDRFPAVKRGGAGNPRS
jgi:hypothetical protein